MSVENSNRNINIEVPEVLNIFIAILSISAACFILWLASHTDNNYVKFGCFILFGFVGNTIFGLLHEAVHSVFHNNKKVNYIAGNIFAGFFPTGFSFQKSCHLNHHRQNRTDYELFETYHDGDSKTLKLIIWYIVLTGVYWIIPGLGSLWLMLSPKTLTSNYFSGGNYKVGRMGGASMLRHFKDVSNKEISKMRWEVLFAITVQILLFLLLDLTFWGWFLCYAGFAIQWSSLQYADHAYSPHDVLNGAWNLKVSKITHWFYLNYHYHLVHHQNPKIPWIHLPKFVDKKADNPSFWKIYIRMWKGLEKIDRPQ